MGKYLLGKGQERYFTQGKSTPETLEQYIHTQTLASVYIANIMLNVGSLISFRKLLKELDVKSDQSCQVLQTRLELRQLFDAERTISAFHREETELHCIWSALPGSRQLL